MSARTPADVLREFVRVAEVQRTFAPDTKEWQDAAAQIGALHDEMQQLTSAALGRAFSATLLGVTERELDVATAVGDRLAAELGRLGLIVLPLKDEKR